MRQFNIKAPNEDLRPSIINKINNLNKPLRSFGILEDIAEQICLVQQSLSPILSNPCHLLFGADHGIADEGVSASPKEVTWQQMINFTKGGAAINMLCRQHDFDLKIIDVGVDHDLSQFPSIVPMKIANGTKNFLHNPAMTKQQLDLSLSIGAEMVSRCQKEGSNILSIGEMGIANTSASSIWMALILSLPLEQCVGAGSGLNANGISHKLEVLKKAQSNFLTDFPNPSIPDIMTWFGGFEMTAAVGSMLQAAEKGIIILIDGFIMTACALAAIKLYPQSQHFMIFTHCGDENGHSLLLKQLGQKPLLNLSMKLGEGTGALCAYPLIDSAVRMVNEMASFSQSDITKYF